MSPNLTGVIYGLAAILAFSVHDALIKALAPLPAPQVLFFTALLGMPTAVVWLIRRGRRGVSTNAPWWLVLRSICVVFQMLLAIYAFGHAPLIQVYAAIFTIPLLVTVLAVPFLGEKIGWRRAAAVFFGLLGVIVALRPWQAEAALGLPHLAALGCALLNALMAVITRRMGDGEDPILMLAWPLVANVVVGGALMVPVYQPMPLWALSSAAGVAMLSLLASWLLIRAYQAGEAAAVAPVQYSQVIWATLIGATFFDEWPDMMTLLGTAIIIASGLFVLAREKQRGVAITGRPSIRVR